MQIILYTIHCPKCIILEQKLKEKEIVYEKCDDEHYMYTLGLDTMPILEVDGNRMEFSEAVKWIKKQETVQ